MCSTSAAIGYSANGPSAGPTAARAPPRRARGPRRPSVAYASSSWRQRVGGRAGVAKLGSRPAGRRSARPPARRARRRSRARAATRSWSPAADPARGYAKSMVNGPLPGCPAPRCRAGARSSAGCAGSQKYSSSVRPSRRGRSCLVQCHSSCSDELPGPVECGGGHGRTLAAPTDRSPDHAPVRRGGPGHLVADGTAPSCTTAPPTESTPPRSRWIHAAPHGRSRCRPAATG